MSIIQALNIYMIIHLCCVLWILFVFNTHGYEPDTFEMWMIFVLAPAIIILLIVWTYLRRNR